MFLKQLFIFVCCLFFLYFFSVEQLFIFCMFLKQLYAALLSKYSISPSLHVQWELVVLPLSHPYAVGFNKEYGTFR